MPKLLKLGNGKVFLMADLTTRKNKMATYVLVSGAWHASWCWERIQPMLEAEGHTVIAPDLLGMGQDNTPLNEATIANWGKQIAGLIEQQSENVILMGHSRGGLVISEAAELMPEKISKLVYLTAMLIPNVENVEDILNSLFESFGEPSPLIMTETSVTVDPDRVSDVFYSGTNKFWTERAKSLIGPEPIATFSAVPTFSKEKFGSVPRIYIECLKDNTIPIELQRKMEALAPCEKIYSIESDHSPFYSCPQELANCLIELA